MTTGPVLPAAGVSGLPALGSQPGQAAQMIRAKVMAVLEDGLLRLAVSDGTLDVRADIKARPGSTVELIPQPPSPGRPGPTQYAIRAEAAPEGAQTTQALARAAVAEEPASAPPSPQAQRVAVMAAAGQTAAQRQGGMAPLMADLTQALTSAELPPPMAAAISQVLARRTSVSQPPTAPAMRQAMAQSGLFLEQTLSVAAASGAPLSATGDMKAALLVLKQALAPYVRAATAAATPEQAAQNAPANPVSPRAERSAAPLTPPGPQPTASAPRMAPPQPAAQPPPLGDPESAPPNKTTPPADQAAARGPAIAPASAPILAAAPSRPAEVMAASLPPAQSAEPALAHVPQTAPADIPDGPGAAAPVPPPPYGRGPLAAQPPATPTLPPGAAVPVIAYKLMQETDAALARHELMQLASIPDSPTRPGPVSEHDRAWMFEIPLATPQGSAVAQFEISRDGGGGAEAAGAGQTIWRARFTVDLEPLGPVHAHVALAGERANVSVWAERPDSLARLRDHAPLLTQALATAQLTSEVAFHPGSPTLPRPASGRFVDMAS